VTHERELTEPVDLCLPNGSLNPDAIGWSRRPLHRCNLGGPWGRQKRWDYWAVTSQECALSITCANLDYLALVTVALFDFASGKSIERGTIRPLARGLTQGERVGDPVSFRGLGLSVAVQEQDGGTRLRVRARGLDADVVVQRHAAHETLSVIIPWSDRRFQFTSKHNTLPATGRVHALGRSYGFSPANQAFACLDYGRGVWPFRTTWNWASASGTHQGRTIGLQLGGKWTDGTGMTENALCVDGRLHKIGDDVQFAYDTRNFMKPWTLSSPRVALRFVPFREKTLNVPLVVAGAELHLCFGHFSGTVITDDGTELPIDRLLGWSEEFRGRW
jgi:hypothetical protein